jgi:hypothetical protein
VTRRIVRTNSIRLLAVALPAVLLPACGSDSPDPVEEPQVTGVVVSPQDFLGAVPCVGAPGGMRLYVAQLIQITAPPNPDDELVTPTVLTSGAVRCEQGIAFGQVTPGATYAARLWGYDRADLDAAVPGEPTLVDRATGEPVSPRWTGTCGCSDVGLTTDPPDCSGYTATRAEYRTLRQVRNCSLVDSGGGPSATQVSVTLDAASCEATGGAITSFTVSRDGESVGEGACGAMVTLPANAGELFELELLAFNADDPESPASGTVCRAKALAGTTVTAVCDPLQAQGGIEVPLETAIAALGATCDEGLRNFSVSLDGAAESSIELTNVECGGVVRFNAVEPGARELSFAAQRGDELLSGQCSATVKPGLVARPACDE